MGFKLSKVTVFICVSILFLSLNSYAKDSKDDRLTEVSMRMIGHEVLLYHGDSTSRILPIQKVDDRYRIQFESEFEFRPEELVATVDSVIAKANLAESYLVQVEDCKTKEVVYSYVIGFTSDSDIIPCGARDQPKACYNLLMTILNNESADDTRVLSNEGIIIDQPYGNLLVPILLLLCMIGGCFILFKRRTKDKVPSNSDVITLGEYQFDPRNMKLFFGGNSIELTSKESELLHLLHSSANATIKRENILKIVWGDEGDYVGRTLDVFISKLRKKLQGDPNIKITNIRGVGYRLILNNIT